MKTQRGFTVVEGLLIVLVVTVVGFGGYYVWNSQNGKDKTNSPQTNSANNTDNKSKDSTDSEKAFLDIKEWGVKIELSDKDKAAYYKMREDDPTLAEIYSKTADAITGPKGVACKGEYIAYILRLPPNDSDWEDPMGGAVFGSHKVVGSYQYGISTLRQYGPECLNQGNDATGYEVNEATEQKFDAVVDQFVDDFKTIQAN